MTTTENSKKNILFSPQESQSKRTKCCLVREMKTLSKEQQGCMSNGKKGKRK